MNIEIVITWYKDKPVGFWLNDELIWETEEIITDFNLIETKISLPLLSAVKFCTIFLNGLTTNRLLIVLAAVKQEVARLEKLQTWDKDQPDEWNSVNFEEDEDQNLENLK